MSYVNNNLPSYPRPSKTTNPAHQTPRPLLPLQTPPQTSLKNLPQLPSSFIPRSEFAQYSLSTHFIPAAYPRSTPHTSEPPPKADHDKLIETILKEKEVYIRESKDGVKEEKGDKEILWNVVNRYVLKETETRRKTPAGHADDPLTLIFTHPNGLSKETWETTLSHLPASSRVNIKEIWTIDAVQHGDSGLVNEGKLGVIFDWIDHARDILNFIQFYLPQTSEPSAPLPLHLPRHEKESGLDSRTVIGIGHSFGGNSMARAAISSPHIFTSLILIDPIIVSPATDRTEHVLKVVNGSIKRRNHWVSREAAKEYFQNSPFFGVWDPAVIESYTQFGLLPDHERGGVKLKMSGFNEAVVFAESRVANEVWVLLPTLPERLRVHWIMAGKRPSRLTTGTEEETQQTVWRRPENSSNVKIPGAGHLVAQEAPAALAREIMHFLEKYHGMGKERNAKL